MLPTLETERLTLRRAEFADAADIEALVSDPRIAATMLNIPHPYPEGGALEWINHTHQRMQENTGLAFVVVLKAEKRVIGAVSMALSPHKRSAEIGYWIGVPYWAQGYMTEAVQRVIDFGFEELGLNRIYATYFVTNPASRRVMQKVGMSYEGTLIQHVHKGGRFLDMALCSILRSEYDARKAVAL